MNSTYNAIKDQLKDVVTTTNDIEELRTICHLLLNMVEELAESNRKLTLEVQDLRDEVNLLKGEKGKPKFKSKAPPSDHSSEDERKPTDNPDKGKKPKGKKHKITVTRQSVCPVDKSQLPKDAIFKGYRSVIIQDIIISADNIEFRKEVYYSPTLGKNFTGQLPVGYSGDYGPNIKALILSLHNASNMTESAIVEFLTTHGVLISSASVARIIVNGYAQFKDEKAAIIEAGLSATTFQHIDDTGAKVDGKQSYAHVLCNQFYTAYFTRPDKSRLTLLDILSGGKLEFRFDALAYEIMENMKLPQKALDLVQMSHPELSMNRAAIDGFLFTLYPEADSYKTARRIILEATAIAGYRNHPQAIELLLCDDAPQFKLITQDLALCWVHEGRHYKKLTPLVAEYREEVNVFLGKFWNYYRDLLKFKISPNEDSAQQLSDGFDTLFSLPVQYRALSSCMDKTRAKKHELLAVLRYPEVPLHNNPAEHGARAQARKRDISFHTKTNSGTLAKDVMMTVVQTARKLEVNIYQYLYDRISKIMKMPSLAEEILIQSRFA
jgi:hypothetical protein